MGAKDQGFGFTPGFLQVVNVLFKRVSCRPPLAVLTEVAAILS